MTDIPENWPSLWVRRLRRQIDASPGPVVQIWGWPGSGKRLLLAKLVEAGGFEIPPSLVATPEALGGAAERARREGSPYLLCRKWPSPDAEVLDVLPSWPLLVFTSRRRLLLDPDSASLISPDTLLLTESEAAGLWEAVSGSRAKAAELENALQATGGWYEPLRLIAQSGKAEAAEAISVFLEEVLERAEKMGAQGLARLGFSSRRADLPPILQEALQSKAGTRLGSGALGRGKDAGRFRAQLLGMPQVWRVGPDEERTAAQWMVRRSLKIFAFLATNPERRATRADLVATAFLDETADVVRRNFHPTLSHLRRSLRADGRHVQPIRQQAGTYFLAPEMEWEIDVDRLLAGAQQLERLRDAEDLEAAARVGAQTWSIYKGPFMEGEEDPWIVARRENLHRIYLHLLRDLGGVYATLGRPRESLDAYRAVLLEDPLQETVQAAVMGIYASLGRRDLVRRQYDRLSKLLVAELGVEPLPETTFEYHRLMG